MGRAILDHSMRALFIASTASMWLLAILQFVPHTPSNALLLIFAAILLGGMSDMFLLAIVVAVLIFVNAALAVILATTDRAYRLGKRIAG